ncbi:hypothetical protein ACQ4LE_002214 [Meloidogyne hapla]|uniref:Uncharacterized protein n=1 Tax=Meloidogyne hapla TaxID=6305 RepID=A0A1I8BRW0_MELHA
MLTQEELKERQAKIDENMKKTKVEYRKVIDTPLRRYQYRMEAFKVALYVLFPVAAVWIFNSTFFEEKTKKWRAENPYYNSEVTKKTNEQFKHFYEEFKEAKRQEEHAKFLREQMAFEEAKKFRKQHGI